MKANPEEIFLTEAEVARRSNLPISALRRIFKTAGIRPAGTTAAGRIRLFSEKLVAELRASSLQQ
jgi:DNA-binding transcriptional MerR regulator